MLVGRISSRIANLGDERSLIPVDPKTPAWQDRAPKGPAGLVVEGEAQLDKCYYDL